MTSWGAVLSKKFDATTITIGSALGDANSAIKLNPDWPKGYFRKAKALVGLGVSFVCVS